MKNVDNITFEEAMNNLEDIVARLEGGALSLDDSINEFESAVKLIKLCEEKLSFAKQRVRMLTEAPDGSVTDVPFVDGEDNAS